MEELGYRPNYAARALKHGTFKDVGVVLFDMTAFGNAHILNGIVNAARDHGFATTIRAFESGSPATLQNAIDQMKTLPVDGVVFILEQKVADFNTFKPTADLPVVLISEEPANHCPTIDTDQYGHVGDARRLSALKGAQERLPHRRAVVFGGCAEPQTRVGRHSEAKGHRPAIALHR